MKLFRAIRRFYQAPFGEEGGGGAIEAPASTPEPSAPAAETPPAQASTAPAAPAAPASMLEAISRHFETQPRDEAGRWTPKVDATGAVIPGQVQPPNTTLVQPATAQALVAETVDPLAMPEGLGPKAQERFQKLANTVKEREAAIGQTKAELDTARRQTEYIRETFVSNGVKQDQFEQAVGVIAMINKGDYAGAEKVLTQQLQQIALMTGRQVGQVDALANFPDLRAEVDGLQITEGRALEIARARMQQSQQQATQQRTQETQQTAQQEKAAFDAGISSVDKVCQELAASDMDWPVVEAQLMPVINKLLAGVPPQLWAEKVKDQVSLIKATAKQFRPAPTGGNALRPTGQASPQQAPKSMAEAMWGKPLAA